jgi:hypothetical protein
MLVFLCPWETHGNLQNKKPQRFAIQKKLSFDKRAKLNRQNPPHKYFFHWLKIAI